MKTLALKTVVVIAACLAPFSDVVAQSRSIAVVLPASQGADGFEESLRSGIRGFERQSRSHSVDIFELPASADGDAVDAILKQAASTDAEAVLVLGGQIIERLPDIAPDFPRKRFITYAVPVTAPNVQSILLSNEHGAFLAGAVAAGASGTGLVGFVGGMDIPPIQRYECGFRRGVQWRSGDVRMLARMAGNTGLAFDNPELGRLIALELHESGADIIFHAAGATGIGVIDAARERGFLAIGVDVNQNGVAPGSVLTSLLVRAEIVVSLALQSVAEGRWAAGVQEFGFPEGAFALALDQHNLELFGDDLAQVQNEATDWLIENHSGLSEIARNNCVGDIR